MFELIEQKTELKYLKDPLVAHPFIIFRVVLLIWFEIE